MHCQGRGGALALPAGGADRRVGHHRRGCHRRLAGRFPGRDRARLQLRARRRRRGREGGGRGPAGEVRGGRALRAARGALAPPCRVAEPCRARHRLCRDRGRRRGRLGPARPRGRGTALRRARRGAPHGPGVRVRRLPTGPGPRRRGRPGARLCRTGLQGGQATGRGEPGRCRADARGRRRPAGGGRPDGRCERALRSRPRALARQRMRGGRRPLAGGAAAGRCAPGLRRARRPVAGSHRHRRTSAGGRRTQALFLGPCLRGAPARPRHDGRDRRVPASGADRRVPRRFGVAPFSSGALRPSRLCGPERPLAGGFPAARTPVRRAPRNGRKWHDDARAMRPATASPGHPAHARRTSSRIEAFR